VRRPAWTSSNALRWHAAQAARSIGPAGWLGVGLLVACALAAALVTAPLAADARRLAEDVDATRQRAAAARDTPPPASPREQLETFARRFAGEKDMAPSIARLQSLAKRRGVQLEQAEFRLVSEPTEPLSRYVIVLPVKADYRALRLFCRDALRELPALSLEEVNVRRADAKVPLLEAQLRLVLFIRPGAAGGLPAPKTT
jgi:hypothetical protein